MSKILLQSLTCYQVSIIALQNNQIEVVKSSMLGSILSNLLLVMGMCFFLGGIFNMTDEYGQGSEQAFASGTAQTTCSLMTLSTASMVIPAALAMVLEKDKDAETAKHSILILSRGTAIILLLLYMLYLFFQLRTHKNLFNPEVSVETLEAGNEQENTEEGEEASMSAWSAAAVLIGVTLVISFCADYLVDSIDAIVATGAISKNFIGLILIPIVGNAAEHVTACVVAVRNKMDLVSSLFNPPIDDPDKVLNCYRYRPWESRLAPVSRLLCWSRLSSFCSVGLLEKTWTFNSRLVSKLLFLQCTSLF